MQGWFNICKLITVIQYINRIEVKNHIIISIGAEKALGKIKYLFRIIALKKLGVEGMYHSMMKVYMTIL
jgi:hypothetical protein